MYQKTLLQILNDVERQLHLTPSTTVTSATNIQQIISCINRAQDTMFQEGATYWQEYMGTFITASGKRTYDVTPAGYNYCATSRTFSSATLNNVTVTPKNAVSWDDTFSASKCTATGSSPSVTVTSISDSALSSARVTASIWIQADATNTPSTVSGSEYTVTLTLTDGAGGQSTTSDITVSTGMNRYAITGYFDNTYTQVKFKVSWANTAGILYLDGCQIEPMDWATEYINNTGSTAQARTIFASPDRMVGAGKYRPLERLVSEDIYVMDTSLFPYERAVRTATASQPYFSLNGGQFNLDNVTAGTHVVYRAKQLPAELSAATDTVSIPKPWYWVLVQGAKAYVESAAYDIGGSADAVSAEANFRQQIKTMLEMSSPAPGWSILHNPHARMK